MDEQRGEQRKSGFRVRKDTARKLLKEYNLDKILKWLVADRSAVRILTSLLFDNDTLVCWRAIELLGRISALKAGSNPESVRELLRRLFWMMNDESGNICRRAPEAIGEILANVPRLGSEYAVPLASFISEEPFESGVRFAISRIAKFNRNSFDHITGEIAKTLNDSDPEMRGLSIMALFAIGGYFTQSSIKRYVDDMATFEIYNLDRGVFEVKTVGEIARQFGNID
jgi:hypothetical protein